MHGVARSSRARCDDRNADTSRRSARAQLALTSLRCACIATLLSALVRVCTCVRACTCANIAPRKTALDRAGVRVRETGAIVPFALAVRGSSWQCAKTHRRRCARQLVGRGARVARVSPKNSTPTLQTGLTGSRNFDDGDRFLNAGSLRMKNQSHSHRFIDFLAFLK